MSGNNSRHAHFPWLCAAACLLGLTSAAMLMVAFAKDLYNPTLEDKAIIRYQHVDGRGFLDAYENLGYKNQVERDEFISKRHKIAIAGGALAAASLLSAVLGCIPLPGFVSKRIAAPRSPYRALLLDDDELNNAPLDSISHQVSTIATTNFGR